MHARAGRQALPEDLIDLDALIGAYGSGRPDMADPAQRVVFGTSGHRGSALDGAFTESHILAIAQAVAEYRAAQGIDGPLFVGRDTHGLSEPAWRTTLEVLVGNGVEVLIDARDGFTPTPAVSHAILAYNRANTRQADGILITPSHNPPRDGGIKYNPPSGGPAGSDATCAIAARANQLIEGGLVEVKRVPFDRAYATAGRFDFMGAYIDDLPSVLDLDAIRDAGVRMGADPLGGAAVAYWGEIADRHRLNLTVVNDVVDPRWAFMPLDADGKIRMDCSSPSAMANLIRMMQGGSAYDLAFGNDADADRHGIVTPDGGLMNPNHFLAAAVAYLFVNRPGWGPDVAVGKTLVSSSMIDRVVAGMGRRLLEVPVGFKHFVPGLLDGTVGFGGEESAGATFLRRDGTAWSTDKDGLLLCLLAAEIQARTGQSASQLYAGLTEQYGAPAYARIDAPADRTQKARLAALSSADVAATTLAGQPITDILTKAPGNGEAIGGLKVVTADAWFAARPSGTEDVYKIYAESFLGADHLAQVQAEAKTLVAAALAG
ncbi:MAG: phosphoglucomutase (alpha-D-glucose-1,6-bisphosphate-dependent) [Alphaproteobacteria bacterium]|uniref:phosphoglucomutase (alpha-D-glucose-1,6-bisphosphate-dependent) n=1 Tax=Brevundimonas sp. TaxID=1871086 RepID=UPI0035661DBB|nr:phosphoglucomutase (alpha-D-glucose-1,6-bisphosphate-dependent) [Alphaproteobacteria bacterium]MBU1521232.1 phosphoglucomutase (alpha-D-glucose-1,6-bisphosphate-dependent) [Alphaproteobacteria bacterium]MBU2030608.1 phosphoglucomutase (alpha-D-glucose-1,6-bisphosphate-dependent) [Alphaproteobacteria bacterium]MBU2163639.1 phosphoglucomutase (alpha-D-glucose-1,6-bisphosphate-dependent) [Alphaproteobacteria bacterium]MBU2232357.1 phosphoglucomutase (alpha-D-glucose-1,6-bisphosphate-dependent) 